MHKDDRLMAVQ